MSEISENSNKNVQELTITLSFYYTQTLDSKVFTMMKRLLDEATPSSASTGT
jgi:hypothetical protein